MPMNLKIAERIVKAVDERRKEIVDLLSDLVRIPSVIGHEARAQEFVAGQFRSLGLSVETFVPDRAKLETHEAFIDSGFALEGRPNVIGLLSGDSGRKSLILNGHIDVVSPEPMDQWNHDPWGAEIEGNRLYGRGAADMKAGLTANISAIKILLDLGLKPEGEVLLQSVIEEEGGGGGGTLACLMEGYTADGMIIPEPLPVVCISHSGILYFRVRVKGKTAHAGRAHAGVNAIGKMAKIYHALEDLNARRQAMVKFPLFQRMGTPACHLNVGTLKAGDWPSTVAGFAEMECRISFIPGETREQIRKTIENAVSEVAAADEWLKDHPPVVEWFGWKAEPWYQDPRNPLVQDTLKNVQVITGEKTEPLGSPAGLDTRFAAYFGFPSLSYGPAGELTHGIDEYVNLDSLITATKVIALTTLDWCARDA